MTALANVAPHQLEDARRVLRVLTAAFPTYPVGDDTAELYLAVICNDMPDFGMAMRVVTDWATTQLLFPKPVELSEAYVAMLVREQRRGEAAQRAQKHKRSDGTYGCPKCKDELHIEVTFVGVGDQLYSGVMPCPVCRPDDYAYQNDGHLSGEHDIFICTHPRCESRAEARSKKRHRG